MLCDEVVEVQFETHLIGNKLYNDIYKHAMSGMVGNFYQRNKLVIPNFKIYDSVTLCNFHYTYCSSLHEIELFNLVVIICQIYVSCGRKL